MTADETLNELLVCLFKDLTEIEGRCLITDDFLIFLSTICI